ncbi:hypothetical protein M422DRAFT_68111 [Sphaerobolus stellatus SS14]|uniref:Guanine deaminase n=1 Tax=Sphaerobolus stellatus (strain SS14) TaxID=990650 RepID=A0A0C9VUI1_SPHS4|nr:hypothetical protein M422DRAFT_68111 [Sphaerobolus stellatus SS14]
MPAPPANSILRLFYGPIISPVTPRLAKYLPHALICIDNGTISWIEEDIKHEGELSKVLEAKDIVGCEVTRLRHGQFLMPGFIDTHTHAPQFPNLGRGGQYELLDWLDKLTFPTEAKFGNSKYATKVYRSVVKRLLDCGTTTCCYYSSAHVVGSRILADIVHASGQRAFIGLCNMDRHVPDTYLKGITHDDSLNDARESIEYTLSLKSPLIRPILTPRFAISCSGPLLQGLGDITSEYPEHALRIPVQTHLAENRNEIDFTASLFPDHESYTHIYESHGLLGPATILAHGCYLTEKELKLIKESGAGVSHCPTSNFHLNSGIAKVGEWLDAGVKVGLGTDVSGGFSPSMLTAIQHASIAAKVIAMQTPPVPAKSNGANGHTNGTNGHTNGHVNEETNGHDNNGETNGHTTNGHTNGHTNGINGHSESPLANKPLSIPSLLYLATLGGAQLVAIEDQTGSLEPGKAFDALLVDLRPETGNPNLWWDEHEEGEAGVDKDPGHELQDFLEKFFFCGDDRNIAEVYVQGRMVAGKNGQAV